MKKTLRTSILAMALASAGCVALPTQPRLADSNPASPKAPEAVFRPATPLLMSGNNYAMSPEGEGQPMEMDMKMDMPDHGAQPTGTPQREGYQTPSATPKTHEHHQDNPPKQ